MTEEFLYHIWKYRLFNNHELVTANGELISIIKPGTHNRDAGPDFFNARFKIGDTVWAGNVELHIKTSDWKKHKHQHDKSFSNIILHVVYEHDIKVENKIASNHLESRMFIKSR